MVIKQLLPTISAYFPIGNSPAVCLTQNLPPELEADILLLGCGDARNVLFTSFVDNARKLDVTCCDIEPGIHARNVLLYTLLIDSEANLDSVWNIYYHWKIDQDSFDLLQKQLRKLLKLSLSIDDWHSSVYGPTIRFCDAKTLSFVRQYWSGFSLENGSPSETERYMQGAIDTAKAKREVICGQNPVSGQSGLRSVVPLSSQEAFKDLCQISNHWWQFGTVPHSRTEAEKLNPALLYSPNPWLRLDWGQSPLHSFPLSTGYAPVKVGSEFYEGSKNSIERLVISAKNHFRHWACAFKKTVANKSVIRIFAGDALAFGMALRSRQLGGTAASCPLNLHSDYDSDTKTAPIRFDIVDTSNLLDIVGPINLICLASSLLKYNVTSCLYTETLLQGTMKMREWFSTILCMDVRSMALMLGLVIPGLFTNATNAMDEDLLHISYNYDNDNQAARVRLHWRRCQEAHDYPYLQVISEEALCAFLFNLYSKMFKHEDSPVKLPTDSLPSNTSFTDILAVQKACSTRRSFAFMLSIMKAHTIADWDKCMKLLREKILSKNPVNGLDLVLNLHVFGVDSSCFPKPPEAIVRNTFLGSIVRANEGVPDQLCVTIRVPRNNLDIFTDPKENK